MSEENPEVVEQEVVIPQEENLYEQQLKLVENFRKFFTPEGVAQFDIAFRNMEISRLNYELQAKDRLIEEFKKKPSDRT